MSKRWAFLVLCFCPVLAPSPLASSPVPIRIDASVSISSFRPAWVFGANTFPYAGAAPHLAIKPRVEAAGQVFFRYPDGYAEYYHWNGKGTRDADGRWVPDRDAWQPGFKASLTYRGTTSNYGDPAFATDGDPGTCWRSNPDTAFPHSQWLYVDLKNAQSVNAVSIVWGGVPPQRFLVQYWKGSLGDAWAPYLDARNGWTPSSTGPIPGKGVTQGVSFDPVTTRYVRIFLSESGEKLPVYSIAEIYVLDGERVLTRNTRTLGSPGMGGANPEQSWTVASGTDPACHITEVPGFDFESFMGFARSFKGAVSPVLTVNMAGTPREAAAWVHYANKVRGYGVKYWELGNEMNGHWEAGGPLGAKEYAHRYLEFYDAMKAEDPTILICGPGASDAYVPSNDYDGKTFIQGFVDALAEKGRASSAEVIDLHWYPFFDNNDAGRTWKAVGKIRGLPADLDRWLEKHPSRKTVPLMLSEFNAGAATPFSTGLENGLWLAETYAEYLQALGSRSMASYWCLISPSDAATNKNGGDQGTLQLEENAYRFQPRAAYWAMELLAARWALPGDARDHTMVKVVSGDDDLNAYACLRPDGFLSLLVVNRSDRDQEVRADLTGFKAGGPARAYTLDPARYGWNTSSLPYHADPDLPPRVEEIRVSTGGFHHRFTARSLTVVQVAPPGVVWPETTPDLAPLSDDRPAFNATLKPLDDFEDPMREGPASTRVNLWGGAWEKYCDPASAVTMDFGPPGIVASGRSLRFRGAVAQGGWSCFQARLAGGWPPTSIDLPKGGAAKVMFHVLGDGKPYRFMVQTKGITDYDYYGKTLTPPKGVWTEMAIPFSEMTRAGWGTQSPGPPAHGNLEDAIGVQVSTQDSGTFEVRMDQIGFKGGKP